MKVAVLCHTAPSSVHMVDISELSDNLNDMLASYIPEISKDTNSIVHL